MILQTGRGLKNESGLCLLDVLAATAIAGVALVVVLQLLINAFAAARTTEQRGLALLIGTSTRVEYEAGALRAHHGQYPPWGEPRILWTIHENAGANGRLQVTVSWKERRQDAALTIHGSPSMFKSF